MRLTVEQHRLAGLDVAYCRDQPDLLVLSARNHQDFMFRELVLNPVHVIAERLVFVVSLCAGSDVPGFHQFVGRFGEQRSAEIDFPQRIRFHHLRFAGLRVQQFQRGQIRALVGFDVDALVSGLKLQRVA